MRWAEKRTFMIIKPLLFPEEENRTVWNLDGPYLFRDVMELNK